MEASSMMAVYTAGATVVLAGRWDGMIRFLGSNFEASVQHGEERDSIALKVEKGKRGLAAVYAWRRESKKDISSCFFIPINWPESQENPEVDLEKPWIPHPERLGQLTDHCVSVRVNDLFYTSKPAKHGTNEKFVPDGNLICRYLVGEASLEEIEAAAVKLQEEKSQQEKIENRIKLLNEHSSELSRRLQEEQQRSKLQMRDLTTAREILDELSRTPRLFFRKRAAKLSELNRILVKYRRG